MTEYRGIEAEPSEKNGVRYWKLAFDAVGDGDGALFFALDPLPEPFAGFDRERLYTENDLEVLRRRSDQ